MVYIRQMNIMQDILLLEPFFPYLHAMAKAVIHEARYAHYHLYHGSDHGSHDFDIRICEILVKY